MSKTNKFGNTFKEEALDLLSKLESYLLDLEKRPTDSELIDNVFRTMHTIKGSGAMFGFDDVVSFVHEIETVFELVRAGKISITGDLISRTLEARDQIRLMLSPPVSGVFPNMEKIGRLIIDFQKLAGGSKKIFSQQPSGDSSKALSANKCNEFPEFPATRPCKKTTRQYNHSESAAQRNGDFFSQSHISENRQHPKQKPKALTVEKRDRHFNNESLSVGSEKLDKFVNLIGELVTVQARLSQNVNAGNDPELAAISEEIERLTNQLRDCALKIRMLPIGTTFDGFRRLVRDLSEELQKEVELITEGADTELDKTVIDKLMEPLMHLFQNILVHGMESPKTREENDKPRCGRICLTAQHSGGFFLIKIEDDGAGLDRDAIIAYAVKKGFLISNEQMSSMNLLHLICMLNLSVQDHTSSLFGTAIGIREIKRVVGELRGNLELDSQKDRGTTITIILPLTLAIIEGLLVSIGKHFFVMPLSVVEECIELSRREEEKACGKNIIMIRGQIVSYIRLREKFGIEGEAPSIQQIVITKIDQQRVGFVVDQVIGEYQTVIKSLGNYYKRVSGISGATILGDGTVALIIDLGKLVMAENHNIPGTNG